MSSDMMKGLEGVLLKADDILVVRETFEEAEKDHDAKLKGFMEYCGEKNYKLHKDEPRFKKRKSSTMDKFSTEGIRSDP